MRVNPDGLKALRLLAFERDTTLQDLAVEALDLALAKYDVGPSGIRRAPGNKAAPSLISAFGGADYPARIIQQQGGSR